MIDAKVLLADLTRLRAMTSDLRNRLLLLLVLPLCVLALLGAWMDYRSADEAASRHDQRLLRLLQLATAYRPDA